ncbi:ATP-binding cassette domain-containing protein [Carnobacterium maltaromaticum]|uniref:ATP-binding cassette domain-containing protein n=1 Tax=Carnobacterium maltaromaticum TaxID=2751 RepID=A0AAW9JT49_CARML|nr:ATP-binding cassette domain-containing protein [Carnobacterium maltaromaticum]MDZ5759712.1 ATP-binding cassette domain-containing protein [Carnobacterium maltaromaticum]
MIKIDNISKKYKDKFIFKHLSLSINDGEMIAITGESGVGKTTFLNCLGQLEQIDQGEILFDGEKITKKKLRKFFLETAGFLFQNFALIDNETVKSNLAMVSKNEELIIATLTDFGIETLLNSKVYQLSGGEQQRVALARLILKNPSIIFADEPTASLDEKNSHIVFEALKTLNSLGKTIIVVTHDMNLASKFDRLVKFDELL